METEEEFENSQTGEETVEKRNTFISGFTSNSIQTITDLLAALAAQETRDFNALNQQLTDLAAVVAGIVVSLSELHGHALDQNSDLANLLLGQTQLGTDIANLETDLESYIAGQLDTTEDNVVNRVSTLIDSAVSDVETAVGGAQGAIIGAIAGVSSQVSSVNSALMGFISGDFATRHDAIDAALSDLDGDLSAFETRLNNTIYDELMVFNAGLASDIRAQLDDNVTTILNALQDHDDSVDAHFSTTNQHVTDLEDQMNLSFASVINQLDAMMHLQEHVADDFFHAIDAVLDANEDIKDVFENVIIHGFLDHDDVDHHHHIKK